MSRNTPSHGFENAEQLNAAAAILWSTPTYQEQAEKWAKTLAYVTRAAKNSWAQVAESIVWKERPLQINRAIRELLGNRWRSQRPNQNQNVMTAHVVDKSAYFKNYKNSPIWNIAWGKEIGQLINSINDKWLLDQLMAVSSDHELQQFKNKISQWWGRGNTFIQRPSSRNIPRLLQPNQNTKTVQRFDKWVYYINYRKYPIWKIVWGKEIGDLINRINDKWSLDELMRISSQPELQKFKEELYWTRTQQRVTSKRWRSHNEQVNLLQPASLERVWWRNKRILSLAIRSGKKWDILWAKHCTDWINRIYKQEADMSVYDAPLTFNWVMSIDRWTWLWVRRYASKSAIAKIEPWNHIIVDKPRNWRYWIWRTHSVLALSRPVNGVIKVISYPNGWKPPIIEKYDLEWKGRGHKNGKPIRIQWIA